VSRRGQVITAGGSCGPAIKMGALRKVSASHPSGGNNIHSLFTFIGNRASNNTFRPSFTARASSLVGLGSIPNSLCKSKTLNRLLYSYFSPDIYTKDKNMGHHSSQREKYQKGVNCSDKHLVKYDRLRCDVKKVNGARIDFTRVNSGKRHQNIPRHRRSMQGLPSKQYSSDKRTKKMEKKTQNTIKNANGGETLLPNPRVTTEWKFGAKPHWRYDPDRWIIVSALCHSLQVLCSVNTRRVKPLNLQRDITFHAATVPEISLTSYLKRIAWFLDCPKACFILALEYIHRLMKVKPEVELNNNSVHQLVVTCIMVSAKFISNKVFKNTYYARVSGLPVTTLHAFEIKLLFFMTFDLSVSPDCFNFRYKAMVAENIGPNKVIIRP